MGDPRDFPDPTTTPEPEVWDGVPAYRDTVKERSVVLGTWTGGRAQEEVCTCEESFRLEEDGRGSLPVRGSYHDYLLSRSRRTDTGVPSVVSTAGDGLERIWDGVKWDD